MKKIFPFAIALLIVSCGEQSKEKEAPVKDSIQKPVADSTAAISDTHYFWEAGFDGKNGMVMKKTRPVPADSLKTDSIVGLINSTYPEVGIELMKQSGDTVFLKVKNSRYLTQQMGSTGAEEYMAETTYNLTEVKGVNFINFNFKQGDHAQPGTYSRTDFINEKK